MNRDGDGQRFIVRSKLGPKGQIVIPKGAGNVWPGPGDSLLLLADAKRGITAALQRHDPDCDAVFGHGREVDGGLGGGSQAISPRPFGTNGGTHMNAVETKV